MTKEKGRIFSVLGDSISTFAGYTPAEAVFYDMWTKKEAGVFQPEDTWWMQVINGLGGALGVNNSYAGSLVSGHMATSGTAGQRLTALGAKGNPDVILVASGSEVSTLADTAALLKEDNIKARVVSCPSEGLFRRQDKAYQEKLLPKNAKLFGLTTGLPITFEGLVGANGKVYGLESFGFSAPYKVLDEKLGYTAANIRKEVLAYLHEAE